MTIDFEGFRPNLIGVSVCHPALQSMYIPLGHKEDVNIDEETREYLFEVLKKIPYRIMHNAAHDLMDAPVLFDLPFICTMIMGHMVNENLMSKSLDFMGKFYCDEGKVEDPLMQSIIKTMGWEYVPFALMNMYGAQDALLTMKLFLKLLPLYEEQFGPIWSPS